MRSVCTHLPWLFTAWMLNSHLDLRRKKHSIRRVQGGSFTLFTDKQETDTRWMSTWGHCGTDSDPTSPTSAGSFAPLRPWPGRKTYFSMSNMLRVRWTFVSRCLHLGGAGGAGVEPDSWQNRLNSSRVNLWQQPGNKTQVRPSLQCLMCNKGTEEKLPEETTYRTCVFRCFVFWFPVGDRQRVSNKLQTHSTSECFSCSTGSADITLSTVTEGWFYRGGTRPCPAAGSPPTCDAHRYFPVTSHRCSW